MSFTEHAYEVLITFSNGDSEGLLVTCLGENLYRAEETSVLGEFRYHDIIEAEVQKNGALQFLRVVTPSCLKTHSTILDKPFFESPRFTAFLDKVMSVGGNWERVFEAFLILNLPPEQESALLLEFNALMNELADERPLQ